MAILLQPRQTATTCNPAPVPDATGRPGRCSRSESKIVEWTSSIPSNAPPCGNVTSEKAIRQQKARTAQTCQESSSTPSKGVLKRMMISTNRRCLLEQRQPLGATRQTVVFCHDLEWRASITCNDCKQDERQGAAPETPSMPFLRTILASLKTALFFGPVMSGVRSETTFQGVARRHSISPRMGLRCHQSGCAQ